MAVTPGTAGSAVPSQRTPPGRGRRPVAERSPHFDHLALDELRAYRRELTEEEDRVSYWRRLLQARIDLVRGGGRLGRDSAAFGRVLSTERLNAGRLALVRVVPHQLPVLPELAELWERRPPLDDEVACARLLVELTEAEGVLSDYRGRLHELIDTATSDLVARYRERPALAIRALPLDPPGRGRDDG